MARSLKSWTKFHLINSTYNCDIEDDRKWTVERLRQQQYSMWQKSDDGVGTQDIDEMLRHLLDTKQILVRDDGFITLGEVFFEKELEGTPVSEQSEAAARKILKDMDDRRGCTTKGWKQDVRDEAVNTWAAMIDQISETPVIQSLHGMNEIYDAGWAAGYDDQQPNCPYPENTPKYKEWWEGYAQGSKDC